MPLTRQRRFAAYERNIGPSEIDRKLAYPFQFALATGVATSSVRYTVNGAYDVDPTLGSTATPGFAEYAAIYAFYRVVRVSYNIQLTNDNTVPAAVYCNLTNTDPTTTMPLSNIGNPLCKWSHVEGYSYKTHRFKDTQTVATILGSDEVEYNDQYRALTSANPADLCWLGIGAHAQANFVNPIRGTGLITMWIRFFDPKTDLPSRLEKTQQLEDQVKRLEGLVQKLTVSSPADNRS